MRHAESSFYLRIRSVFEIEIFSRSIVTIKNGFDRRRDMCKIDGLIGRMSRGR